MLTGSVRRSPIEGARYYEFEPGDSTKYIILVADMLSAETRNMIGGVTDSYKMVTLISPSVKQPYPFNFSERFDTDGRTGYLAGKFEVNERTAKTIASLLEYIRSEEN